MKIQLFYDSKYEPGSVLDMQYAVNRFIEGKEIIDIKLTSEGASNGHSYMIMVIYK